MDPLKITIPGSYSDLILILVHIFRHRLLLTLLIFLVIAFTIYYCIALPVQLLECLGTLRLTGRLLECLIGVTLPWLVLLNLVYFSLRRQLFFLIF